MIDVYYWPTPNGWKVAIMIEELGVPYTIVPVNNGKGEQFNPECLVMSPSSRMCAIVRHEPRDGGEPLSIFESGVILEYLAEDCCKFWPHVLRGRYEVSQWLFWQVGGLGPMAGQPHPFRQYISGTTIPYTRDLYTDEVNRVYGVMDRGLNDGEFLAGDYSIAEIASWAWVRPYKEQGQGQVPEDFFNLKRWFLALAGILHQARQPPVFSGTSACIRRPAPRCDAHTGLFWPSVVVLPTRKSPCWKPPSVALNNGNGRTAA